MSGLRIDCARPSLLLIDTQEDSERTQRPASVMAALDALDQMIEVLLIEVLANPHGIQST
jgi:hypothetical protein